MWSFLPGIFAEEVEDHVQPPWKRIEKGEKRLTISFCNWICVLKAAVPGTRLLFSCIALPAHLLCEEEQHHEPLAVLGETPQQRQSLALTLRGAMFWQSNSRKRV